MSPEPIAFSTLPAEATPGASPTHGAISIQPLQPTATVEITGVAPSAATGAQEPWAVSRDAAATLLGSMIGANMCEAIELRYLAGVGDRNQPPLRLFVTVRCSGSSTSVDSALDSVSTLLRSSGMAVEPSTLMQVPQPDDVAIFDVRRQERLTYPNTAAARRVTNHYYSLLGETGDGSQWATFHQALADVTQPVEVSLLFGQVTITECERDALHQVLTGLAVLSTPRSDIDVKGRMRNQEGCAGAREALELWQARQSSLAHPVLARLSVRGARQQASRIAQVLATVVAPGAHFITGGGMVVVEATGEQQHVSALRSLNGLSVIPWEPDEAARVSSSPTDLYRFRYVFGIKEAGGLAVIPVPGSFGTPGMPVALRTAFRPGRARTAQVQSLDSVPLGHELDLGRRGSPVALPLEQFTRHGTVVGQTGMGKSTTLQTILVGLWRLHQVPFWVIEPSGTEYRNLVEVDDASVTVITVGDQTSVPLRLNLLDVPAGVTWEEHVGTVMTCLKAALPLVVPLDLLIEQALRSAYTQAGWNPGEQGGHGHLSPSLDDLYRAYEAGFPNFRGEALNLLVAGQLRIDKLRSNEVFRGVDHVDWVGLSERNVVFELDGVGDPELKAVLAAYLLSRARDVARMRGPSREVRHVTALEEAHIVLGDTPPGAVASGRAAAVQEFNTQIATMRSYGEGIIICSQQPGQLAPGVVRGTSFRVLHGLNATSEREAFVRDMSGDDEDVAVSGDLKQGQVFVGWTGFGRPSLVSVGAAPGIDTGRVTSDKAVGRAAQVARADGLWLPPHRLCTPEMCPGGCDGKVRDSGAAVATQVEVRMRKVWNLSTNPQDDLVNVASGLVDAAHGDGRTAYCAATHLADQGVALTVKGVDVRPYVVAAVKGAVATRKADSQHG